MKKVILKLIIVLFLMGCGNKKKQKPSNIKTSTEKPSLKTSQVEVQDSTVIQNIAKKEKLDAVQKERKKETLSTKVSIIEISYNEVKFKDLKSEMTAIMGTPDSIIEPKYECGPFSEDWQEMKFYQYFFGNMNFIVYKSNAEIQNIRFKEKEELKIKGNPLNRSMTFEEIADKLGLKIKEDEYFDDQIIIYPKETLDEHYILKFKENKLFQFDRFEPC